MAIMNCGHAAAIMRSSDGYWYIQPNIHLWSTAGGPSFHSTSERECAEWVFGKRLAVDTVRVLDGAGRVTHVWERCMDGSAEKGAAR